MPITYGNLHNQQNSPCNDDFQHGFFHALILKSLIFLLSFKQVDSSGMQMVPGSCKAMTLTSRANERTNSGLKVVQAVEHMRRPLRTAQKALKRRSKGAQKALKRRSKGTFDHSKANLVARNSSVQSQGGAPFVIYTDSSHD